MPDTYTSPFGTTPQATQLQGGRDALAQISGSVAKIAQGQPQAYQDVKTATTNQQGLPGATQAYTDNASKLAALSQAGQQMEQNQGSSQQPSNLTLKMPSDTRGFNPINMPDPALSTQADKSNTDSTMSLLSSLHSYITSGYTKVQNATAAEQQTFRDILTALLGMSDRYMQQYKDKRDQIHQNLQDELAKRDQAIRGKDQAMKEWAAGLTDMNGNPLPQQQVQEIVGYAEQVSSGQVSTMELPIAFQQPVVNYLKAKGFTQAVIDKLVTKRYQTKNVQTIPFLGKFSPTKVENYDPKTGMYYDTASGAPLSAAPQGIQPSQPAKPGRYTLIGPAE